MCVYDWDCVILLNGPFSRAGEQTRVRKRLKVFVGIIFNTLMLLKVQHAKMLPFNGLSYVCLVCAMKI